MSRKHSKVSNNNNVRKSLSLSTMIEKSDKIISTATQFNEKTSKLEKSSRLIPRKTTPTQQRLFKRQPTTMTKHQQQQHQHSQQSSKKLPKNSIAKMMTKRRQSTMKSLSEDDSIPKKISIKKISTTIMRNKHSIMATTKTSIKTNDDNNNNNNNMNVRMNCSSKQKRQRDDSKQTVGARTTTQQQDSAIKSRQPIKETTITQQTSPEKLTATATTTKTASKTTSENPLYIMDENQMLELFKSFLKNISYQQKLQRESASSSSTAAPPTNREKTFVDDKDELEELNAEMIELFGHINTVQSSYQEIVQSLISIQKNNRRHHRTGNTSRTTTTITKQPQLLPMVGDSKCIVGAAAGTGAAGAGGCELKTMTKEMIKTENPKPITLEPFMNPSTRNESFNQLFQRVDRIRTETEQFRTAFTSDGTLQRELYDNNKITFDQYKYWHEQIQELAAIVELILQEYNREVLELFRLSQTPSEY